MSYSLHFLSVCPARSHHRGLNSLRYLGADGLPDVTRVQWGFEPPSLGPSHSRLGNLIYSATALPLTLFSVFVLLFFLSLLPSSRYYLIFCFAYFSNPYFFVLFFYLILPLSSCCSFSFLSFSGVNSFYFSSIFFRVVSSSAIFLSTVFPFSFLT